MWVFCFLFFFCCAAIKCAALWTVNTVKLCLLCLWKKWTKFGSFTVILLSVHRSGCFFVFFCPVFQKALKNLTGGHALCHSWCWLLPVVLKVSAVGRAVLSAEAVEVLWHPSHWIVVFRLASFLLQCPSGWASVCQVGEVSRQWPPLALPVLSAMSWARDSSFLGASLLDLFSWLGWQAVHCSWALQWFYACHPWSRAHICEVVGLCVEVSKPASLFLLHLPCLDSSIAPSLRLQLSWSNESLVLLRGGRGPLFPFHSVCAHAFLLSLFPLCWSSGCCPARFYSCNSFQPL